MVAEQRQAGLVHLLKEVDVDRMSEAGVTRRDRCPTASDQADALDTILRGARVIGEEALQPWRVVGLHARGWMNVLG